MITLLCPFLSQVQKECLTSTMHEIEITKHIRGLAHLDFGNFCTPTRLSLICNAN